MKLTNPRVQGGGNGFTEHTGDTQSSIYVDTTL